MEEEKEKEVIQPLTIDVGLFKIIQDGLGDSEWSVYIKKAVKSKDEEFKTKWVSYLQSVDLLFAINKVLKYRDKVYPGVNSKELMNWHGQFVSAYFNNLVSFNLTSLDIINNVINLQKQINNGE